MLSYINGGSEIRFTCDTPHCKATIDTERRRFDKAAAKARREGWAVGTDGDACRAHHV